VTYTSAAILIAGAYLLGSVPFGLIIAKAHGKDLRQIGSGNIGATNVSRALGRKWAYVCFLLDVLKGLAPTAAANPGAPGFVLPELVRSGVGGTGVLWMWLAVGCAAVLGHIFPVYLRFKGGKGVATSLGVVLGVWPYWTVCGIAALFVWLVFVLVWRYVSLASMAAAAAFPLCLAAMIGLKADWHLAELYPLVVAATAMPVLVIARHRSNIRRLLAGTESKVLVRAKKPGADNSGR
jgi:glycerol-3-phosphate acyltransferase PlsY